MYQRRLESFLHAPDKVGGISFPAADPLNPSPTEMRIPSRLEQRESEVQAAVMRFYRTMGCEVVRFSEGRRTRITAGWPDLGVFCRPKRVFFLHEVKARGGKQSGAQSIVQRWAEECGMAYVIGGVQAGVEHLTALGMIP